MFYKSIYSFCKVYLPHFYFTPFFIWNAYKLSQLYHNTSVNHKPYTLLRYKVVFEQNFLRQPKPNIFSSDTLRKQSLMQRLYFQSPLKPFLLVILHWNNFVTKWIFISEDKIVLALFNNPHRRIFYSNPWLVSFVI